MAKTVSEAFEEFLARLVPTQAQRDAGASHRASVKAALAAKLTVNTFFESGSFSNGTGVRGFSDIDAFVSLGNDKPHKGDAKDLARLIKSWKYYRNVPISSFYLEMRCAHHVAQQKNYMHVWDVCQLLEGLVAHKLAPMNDPKGLVGRIHACSSDANMSDALSKLETAANRARKALDADNAGNTSMAFSYLDLLFDGHFPAR